MGLSGKYIFRPGYQETAHDLGWVFCHSRQVSQKPHQKTIHQTPPQQTHQNPQRPRRPHQNPLTPLINLKKTLRLPLSQTPPLFPLLLHLQRLTRRNPSQLQQHQHDPKTHQQTILRHWGNQHLTLNPLINWWHDKSPEISHQVHQPCQYEI